MKPWHLFDWLITKFDLLFILWYFPGSEKLIYMLLSPKISWKNFFFIIEKIWNPCSLFLSHYINVLLHSGEPLEMNGFFSLGVCRTLLVYLFRDIQERQQERKMILTLAPKTPLSDCIYTVGQVLQVFNFFFPFLVKFLLYSVTAFSAWAFLPQ